MQSDRGASPTPLAVGGTFDMLLSAFFFSVMSLFVKLAGERLPAIQIVLARSVVSLVLSLWIIRRLGIPWQGNHRGLLLLRGLFGVLGLTAFFYAITRLDLADATVLHYTNPLFTAVIAAVALGESFRGRHALALLICLAGVVFVARPPIIFGGASTLPADGVLAALLGAVAAAAAYVTVRALGRRESPYVVVLYFPLVAVPLVTPFAVLAWVPPTPAEWAILLGVGVTTQIAQVFLTRGLSRLPAGRATAIGTVQILWAAIWGVLVFGVVPDRSTAIGAVLVVLGLLLLRERRSRRRPDRAIA